MRSRNVVYSLLLILAVLLFAVVRRWQEPQRKEAFDRSPARVHYYPYALCRMQCLGIDKKAINELLKKGVINFSKSNRSYLPCPIFALQGRTGGKYLRIVFEQCRNATNVLTCYNLEREADCACANDLNQRVK